MTLIRSAAVFGLFILYFSSASTFVRTSEAAEEVSVKGMSVFDSVGKPSMLKIHGDGAETSGLLKIDHTLITGEFTAHLTSLKTGIDRRDEHMKNKYLEISRFPDAVFKLDSLP